jgi:fission process protein 1
MSNLKTLLGNSQVKFLKVEREVQQTKGKERNIINIIIMTEHNTTKEGKVDIFRDTPIRLCGYANELGESFRPFLPVSVVRASYGVAIIYGLGDVIDKGWKANEENQIAKQSNQPAKRSVINEAVDCAIWQGLASVAIPGFTINRVVRLCQVIVENPSISKKLSPSKFLIHIGSSFGSQDKAAIRWSPTFIGLATIPFIVKPIDHSVHFLMDKTIRKWSGIAKKED